MKKGFDNEKYLATQSRCIRERIDKFGDKLYLEFGGKLFDDYHASRVLPGFEPDSKLQLLMQLSEHAEIVIVISAVDIEKNKIRGDLGITYDTDVLRLIDSFEERGLFVGSVVITKYSGQTSADLFKQRLIKLGIKVYTLYMIPGYPNNVSHIVSDEGFGKNDYIETSRPLVVITAPGPGSGKMATCLSQLYQEHRRGIRAGYAKFETFPIWNIPLKHPVNLAYEAATADLNDVNMIDPFHLAAYGTTAVNYNRDIEAFPVVRTILGRICGEDLYRSPTDMGVNMIGRCITDNAVVQEAARQEIIRRYYQARCAYTKGEGDLEACKRIEFLMSSQRINTNIRRTVAAAVEKSRESGRYAVAIELPDGQVVTGKSSELMNDTAAAVLNSIKALAGLSDEILLISPVVLEPIIRLKKEMLGSRYPVLKLEEVLLALSISAALNPTAQLAMEQLPRLRGCDAHCSDIITQADANTFLKLGVNVTCEPQYPTKDLYFK